MVSLGPQTIRLRPPLRMRNAIMSYALTIGPSQPSLRWGMDDHANLVSTAIFTERMAQFIVDVSMIVDLSPYDPLQMQTGKRSAMGQDNPAYRRPIADKSVLECFLRTIGFFSGGDTELSSLTRLAQAIATRLHYMRRMEPGVWPPAETLAREAGSCRDSAWLLIALARNMGYAARFVSGYLVEPSALQADPDRLVCDLHAWAEICIPGSVGGVRYDIRTHCGAEPYSACCIRCTGDSCPCFRIAGSVCRRIRCYHAGTLSAQGTNALKRGSG
ncbi:transglutaminase-like domain-containing protein [Asaia prunellae]|uniref:transglutaminase-like domain-containing protein n=1 Tax=Asaia prunellae TaxID=610245 RepID=UPI001FB0B267|nr:transglutaminase family protein [Asaia prunellae]